MNFLESDGSVFDFDLHQERLNRQAQRLIKEGKPHESVLEVSVPGTNKKAVVTADRWLAYTQNLIDATRAFHIESMD